MLTDYQIESLLTETLNEMEFNDKDVPIDDLEIYENAVPTTDYPVLKLSADPISIVLHPLHKTQKDKLSHVQELQSTMPSLGHMDGGSMATTTN